MNETYIVEKEFDYTDYANQTYHIDKGVFLSYEIYTRDDMIGMNNSLAIHLSTKSGNIIIRGPFIFMSDYVREITQEDIKKAKYHCDNILNEEIKKCEDSLEITEPTELQKEQTRKILGWETQTEAIINYLKRSIEKCSDKHILNWLNEELDRKERWLDTINFCNTSDKDIISQALINFSNKCRTEGKHTEANKIDTVRENYLNSFGETKAVEDD